MNDFEVSVIIPVYNSERTIIRAINSVVNQTKSELIKEIIIVNDGSTDRTEEKIIEYSKSEIDIPLKIINKKNGGVSSARNKGLENAKGNWIALLDSDDEWKKDKLEIQYRVIKENPQIDFLGGNHQSQDIRILWKKIRTLYKATIKDLCIKMFPQTSTVIFRKKIYDEIGGYDEKRKYCEDAQYFMKICCRYNYYYLPKQLVVYDNGRRGFGVSGLSGNIRKMQEGYRLNLKELFEKKRISLGFYFMVSIFAELKYFRRIIIVKVEK